MLLPMLTNFRLADLRLTTAQQRSTGQNLPSDLYMLSPVVAVLCRQDVQKSSALC
jgi:hypothetical protein